MFDFLVDPGYVSLSGVHDLAEDTAYVGNNVRMMYVLAD